MNRRTFLHRAAVVPAALALPAAAATLAAIPKAGRDGATLTRDGIGITLDVTSALPKDGEWHTFTFQTQLRTMDVDSLLVETERDRRGHFPVRLNSPKV